MENKNSVLERINRNIS